MILTTLTANPKESGAEKVRDILTNDLKTMDDTRKGSNVIDAYEEQFPSEIEFIYEMRNLLCDRTFAIYAEIQKGK